MCHIHGSVIFRATRYEESHDSVSGPRPMSKRIAFRPPFGLGLQMGKAVASVLLLSNGIIRAHHSKKLVGTLQRPNFRLF